MASQTFHPKQLQKNALLHVQALYNRLLETPLTELYDSLEILAGANPCLEITPPKGRERPFKERKKSRSTLDVNEWNMAAHEGLYPFLERQIDSVLFPTPKSQKIAQEIVNNLTDEGYLDTTLEEISLTVGVALSEVERVHNRFRYLEPPGIGARNFKEAMLFSLNAFSCDDELQTLLEMMIADIEHLERFRSHLRYAEAKILLAKLRTPPALDFIEASPILIPDIIVNYEDNNFSITLNNDDHPLISVNEGHEELFKEKLKEARDIFNLIEIRKTTLLKVAIAVVEEQYRYFLGGPLVPLTMEQIAQKVGFGQSTVSRTLAGKTLWCHRGIVTFRELFTNAVGKNLSSRSIKEYLLSLIEKEEREEPLSDQALCHAVEKNFNLTLTRRAITKYRLGMGILSATERKRLYQY